MNVLSRGVAARGWHAARPAGPGGHDVSTRGSATRRPSAGRAAERAVQLTRLVTRFARARVLVIGDLMLDRFIWGAVNRISPEAPVPVVQVTRESAHPGGAGNVVANLAALGARTTVYGWVGRDAAGRAILSLLGRLGADARGVLLDDSLPSIEKTRIIAHSQQVVRLDRDGRAPSRELSERMLARVGRALEGFDAVLVSDYGKGAIQPPLLEMLAERRKRDGYLLLIDPKQPNFPHYRGATLIKPNQGEAAAASGVEIRDEESLREAGARLLERWQSEAVLISRGEHGMALCRPDRPPRWFSTSAREVFDVTGAGDTVIAIAALALASGSSLAEAPLLANLGAGIVVGKVGTATVTRAELAAAIDSDRAGDHEQVPLVERSAGRRADGHGRSTRAGRSTPK